MIVGIGELLWDIFPDGRKVAGGAPFNFAFHCRQLGHEATIVSRVGDDELGRELRAEVRRLGLTDEFVQTDPDHPTGTVRVSVDADGQPSYVIVEDVAWDYLATDERLEEFIRATDAVCFGSLGQRQSTAAATIRRLCEPAGGPLRICDVNLRSTGPDGDEFVSHWGRHCDWFKLSNDDLLRLNDPAYVQICEPPSTPFFPYYSPGMDQRRFGILTSGAKGCAVLDWQRLHRERGVPAEVVDTVGAGDAFLAAFLCSHLEGRSLKTNMRFAMHYAARVCEHQGATPRIDRDEVEIRLLDDPWMRGN